MSGASGGVLLLGATGRTGGRVLVELLARGVPVRVIVRSPMRLPPDAASSPLLTVVEAEVASLSAPAWRGHVAGRHAVISCLGHTLDLRGIFGAPRDLVTCAVRAVDRAAVALGPADPIRLILMSSVSVHRPAPADPRRGVADRAFLALLRALLPPARDNQRAADHLARTLGADHPSIGWVVVRPDSLVEGTAAAYRLHDALVAGLFRPGRTRRAQVAHFMADLATDDATWERWRGGMPVIVEA